MTPPVPPPKSVVLTLDKGTPGESRGRKAKGPRLLRENNLVLVGQGQAGNFTAQESFHVTFNANGEVVSVRVGNLVVKQCTGP